MQYNITSALLCAAFPNWWIEAIINIKLSNLWMRRQDAMFQALEKILWWGFDFWEDYGDDNQELESYR